MVDSLQRGTDSSGTLYMEYEKKAEEMLRNAIDENRFPAVFSSTPIARLIKDKFKEKYQYANAIS